MQPVEREVIGTVAGVLAMVSRTLRELYEASIRDPQPLTPAQAAEEAHAFSTVAEILEAQANVLRELGPGRLVIRDVPTEAQMLAALAGAVAKSNKKGRPS